MTDTQEMFAVNPFEVTAINLHQSRALVGDFEIVALEVVEGRAFVAGPCCAGKWYAGLLSDYVEESRYD